MSKKEKIKQIISEKRDKIKATISSIQDLNKQIPQLKNILTLSEWEYNTIVRLSTESIDNFDVNTENYVLQSNEFIEKGFPYISSINPSITVSGLAMSASSSAAIFHEASKIQPSTNPQIYTILREYNEIQTSQKQEEVVLTKLKTFAINIADTFKNAMDSIKHSKAVKDDYNKAALEIRNFLEKFKGELYSKSSRVGNFPKNQKWGIMSEDISRKNIANLEEIALKGEEQIYDRLHNDLSSILKNRTTVTDNEFENLTTEFLSHMYSIINLIDDSYFTVTT